MDPSPSSPKSGDNAGEKETGECANGPEASGVDTASAMSKTTTISTIAVQSGKTRIVIALLHCGDWLDLKVLEITPDLASLGNTLQEALELQKAHDEVLRQLQNKQSPVEELLRQADHLISTQKPRAEVYAAMAESLGRAWKDINLHLEFRKQILDLNVQYHSHARDFFTKVEELEAACKDTVVPIEIDAVKRFLTDIHEIRRALLEAHMNALQSGNSLINKLKELGAKGTLDSRPDRIRTSVNRAISQVQEWMDELHTKRQVLETTFVKRKAQLEQCLALAILAVDLKEVEEAVNKGRDALANSNELGDSSSSAELLLQWHRKLLPEAQQLQERALKITKATEQLEASGCFASEQAKDQAYKVLSTTSDYLTEITEHNALLEKVIHFFRAAQTAFTKLDQLEIQLQTTELPSSSPQLARLHAQCAETIANLTTPPIELGHNILREAKPGRGTEGVRRTVEELENRKITLEGLCTAHREDKLRINRALNEFLEKHEELYSWLKSIAEAFLQGHQDMGSDYLLAKDFLDLHNQLLNDLQTKGNEINSLLLTLPPILEYLEDDQRRDVDSKVESLHEHWVKLKNILEKRLDLASIYVKFHNEANRVNDKIDKLEESLRANVGNTEDDIFKRMEEEWEQIVPLYQSAKNTGITFINETKKMSEAHLDTKRACVCVESVLEKLSNRQVSVTRTWQTYKTDVEERREVHLQWEQIIMQSSKTLNWVTKLESQLYPLIDTFATSPSEIINHLERKQETVLPEIRRAQNEVEQRIKMTETLISKSSQIDEQSLNIKNKLIELNQKLIEISSEYQILLQVLIGFFKNLVELDKTTENLNSQFGKAGLPKNEADVELLIREHEASRQAVLEMFRFTQNECDQLKSRIIQQEPKVAAEQDVSKLETMLETRKVTWEEEWKRRRESLESQKKISHFSSELKTVDENIDELSRQLSGFKEQCRESQSTTKTVAQTFTHFTKVTETLDIRVKNLVKEGEKLVHENHLQSPQIEFNLNQLQEKWSIFKKETQDTKHLIELSTKYYEIVNEADQWLKDGSRILVSVAKRTSAIKRPEEAQQLLHEVENFVKPGQAKQSERIQSISQLSKELFSPGWSKEETEIQVQHKEIIESFSSIISELHTLSQNLKSSEEQQEKLKREQAEADAKLAAAKAEAERAREAAKVAEEEKRAAEEAKRAAEDAKRAAEEAKLTAETAVKTLQETMTSQTVKEIQVVREEVPQQVSPMVPPVFVSPLSDVVIQEGAKFTFMCTVTGTPTPVVTWYKDGISIQNNPDYQTSFEHGLCALTIEETFAEDSARYSCKAVNAAGSAETSAFLAVKEPQQEEQLVPPTFVKLLQPGFAKEGSKFQFECKVEGYPLPTVQWFKGSECIDHSPDYVITYNNGEAILKFEKVTLNDKAEYTCKATNNLGVAQSRTNLNIESAQSMEAPFFVIPLSNVMARAGQKIKLECEVTGVPTPNLTWTQNGKVIKESRDLKLLREGKRATLVISEAFPKDAGTFAVTASNTAGEAISSCNVTVKGRLPTETSDSELASDMEPIKPSIQLALKDASVFEGQKVRLDCVIVGQPEPEVIWYRDDSPVKESSDFQLLFQGDRCSLIILEAFSEDAGEYKVVALNSAGEATSKCKLIVTPLSDKQPAPKPPHEEIDATGSPPKFSKLLSDVLVSENERVIFEATVSGQPRPEIKWLLNNQEITQSSRIITTYDQQGNVSLQIDSVKPEDRGVYTVKAQNSLGEAKCFAQLIVKTAKPIEIQKPFEDIKSPPFFNERFTDRIVIQDTSTKFECIVTGKPIPKVRWFFNDEPVSGKDFLVSTSGDRQVLTIPTVTKENEGKITCIAENEAGTSTWSAKLSVQSPLEISPFPPKPSTEIQRHVESSYILKKDVQVESSSTLKKISSNIEPQVQTHTIKSHDEKSVTQINQEQPKVVESHKVEEYRTFGDHEKQFSSITSDTKKEQEQSLTIQKKIIKLRPPKFINPIMGKIVDQNTKVVLEGILDGQPTPTVSWTKNGTELRQSDNVKISYEMGRPRVEILNTTSSDAGRYTCTAVNEAGSAVSTSDLVVRKIIFPPVFGRRLQAQVVKKGERIRMEVEVTGTPEPTVSWYKDGILMTSEQREGRRILRQGNSYTLIIEKADLKDQGKYMVRAVNEGGEAQSIADFAVYEPTPDTMMEVVKTVVFEDVRKHEMLSSTEDKTKSVSSTEQRIPISTKTFDSSTFALPEIEKSIVTKKEIIKSTTPTNFTEKFSSQSSQGHCHTSESHITQSSESKSESKSEKIFTGESTQQPSTVVRSIDSASFMIPEVEKSVVSKTEIFKSSSPMNLQEHVSKSLENQVLNSTFSNYGELEKKVPEIAPQSFSTVDSARYVFPDGEKSVVSKTELHRSSTPYGTEERKIFQTSSSSMSQSHSSTSEKFIKSDSSTGKVPFPHPEFDKSVVSNTELFRTSSPMNVQQNACKSSESQAYSSAFSSQYGDLARKEPGVVPQHFSTVDSAKYVFPDGESSVVSKSEVFKSDTPYGTQEKKIFQTSSSSMSQSYSSGSEKFVKSESSTGKTPFQIPSTAFKADTFKSSDLVKKQPEIAPQSFSTVDSARYVFPDGEKSVSSKTEVYQSSTPYGTQEKKIFQTSSSSMSQSHSSTSDKFIKGVSSTDRVPFPHPEIDRSVVSKTDTFKSSDLVKKQPEIAPQSFSTVDSARYVFPDGEKSVSSKTEVYQSSTPYGTQEKKIFQTSSSSMSQSHSSTSERFIKSDSSADRVPFSHPEIDRAVVSKTDAFKSSDLVKKQPEIAPQSFSTVDSARYVFPDGEKSVSSKTEVYQSSTPYGTQEKKILQTSSSSMSQSHSSTSEKFIKSDSSADRVPFPHPEIDRSVVSKADTFKSSDLVKQRPEIAPQNFSTVDSARYVFPDGEKSVISKSEVYRSNTPYGTEEKKVFQTSSSSMSQSFSSSGDKLIKSETSTDKGTYFVPEAPTSLISKTETIKRETPSFTTSVIDSASYTIPEVERSVVSKTEISKTSTPYSHQGETLTSESKSSESSMFSQSQQSLMKETQITKETKVITLDHTTPEVPKVPSLPKYTVPEVPITHREVVLKTDISGPGTIETKKESFLGEAGFQTSSKQSTMDFSVKKIYKGDESDVKKETHQTSTPTIYKRYEEISKPVLDAGYKASTFQGDTKIISSHIPTKFAKSTTKEEFALKPEPPPEICYAPIPETHQDTTIETTKIETHTELPSTDQTYDTKSFTSAQKHFQELSRKEETHSSRKFETSESMHKRTRSISPKPNQGASAMEKMWTRQRSFDYETVPSVSSSYSRTVERHTTAPRPISALSVSSQEQSFEKRHDEKSYSTQSTLEKKWTPFEKKHETRIEKTKIVSAPEPIQYIAEVTGLQHQFKHDSFQETTHSESEYAKGETSSVRREEIKEEVNLKPSQLKKTWPPSSSEEHVLTSTSKLISASPSITPSVHSLSVRPISVQDITDEVYLEPGPPPEIGYAPPVERRQSYVELIERDLERNLEKEPAKLPAGAIRTIPPPLPPKNEQYQPPPLPAKPIKLVEPPKKIKKDVESKPFERFPDLEPFPFSPGLEKPKPLKAGPPPTPSKFVKGKFTDSDYESDIEAVRIPAKWKPSASDTEEPAYKKVRPPTASPSFRSRSVEPEPLPPSKFDQPPESSGPPRPTIDFRKTLKRDAALERKLARHSYPKAQEPPRQPTASAEPVLKPGSPPVFMEAPPPPKQKPESPKAKHKPIIDGYMADTDEPRTLVRKSFKEDNVKMEQKQTLYSDANIQKSFEQTRTSHAPTPRIYKKHVSSSTKKELVSTPIITNISTTETVTEKQDRSETRESYNYQSEISKPKKIRGPPPPSPSKFIKGEFRESDYESDYDGKKIRPVWTPQDTPMEKAYKPVRPILTPSGRHSQTSTGRRTPTPPTEFDNPPQIIGPPRPKFEPIEKPAPTLKIDKFMKHEERKQVVHKPKPVTAKPQPITDIIIATPAAPEREIYLQPGTPPEMGFAPGPKTTQYYKSTTSTPFHNAVQTETSNVMHFKESTESSQRTVSLQQTRKVITFGKQDSSSSSQHTSERRRSAPPPTRPKKFIPGEFRESDYESEVETAKIRPLWVPSESDNEEPRYRKVRPPQPTRSLSLPGAGEEYSASVETKSSCRQESSQSSYHQKMSKDESSRNQSSKHSEMSNELVYQPGPQPEYGYMPEKVAKSEATKLASRHMEDMTQSFKSKTQNFVSDIMSDISKKKTSSATDMRNGDTDAQVYREESRAAQYGTKHVDPDTGLIYFKYDFGYEFGIILPGEGKGGEIPVPKKTIIEPPKRSRDIEMPVYHETTKSPGAPEFKPNKLTVPNKTVRWEPTSESEMSEYESDGRRKGIGNRWEQSSASPVSLSPSLPSTSPAFNQYGSGRGVETPTSTPGTSTPGSTSASYSTKKNLQAQRAPLFITPLRDIAVVKGQPARFECIVQSEFTPTVLWSKDGVVISNNPNHQLFFRNGVCRLTIPQAYPDDAGTYNCTATNPVGAVSTSATLQVPGERRSQYI